MATEKRLNNIFLSASIPSPDRERRFYDTADIIAIRDAVKALASVVIPKANLIWGGHPSITPLIKYVLEQTNANVNEHMTLYQSLFFENEFIEDNSAFSNIIFTPKQDTLKESIDSMRLKMIGENIFSVGVFIGGMEGIFDEYYLFKEKHPNALIIPLASTGGASRVLCEEIQFDHNERLTNDYAYMVLFRDLLKGYIDSI